MPSIFISGIPKGLDRETTSRRIKRDIETVAQVKTIWIQKEKGYGFVSLHAEASADFVLDLNEKICINGNALRIMRWRSRTSRLPETPRRTTAPTCKQQVNNDVFVLRGYDTYTNYRCHRPQTDVLYQYIQQAPKQKQLKRKPWKDRNRVSQLSSPKSRKIIRAKRQKSKRKTTRNTKIKHSTSPSEVGLHYVSKRHKRSQFNSDNDVDDLSNVPIRFTRKTCILKETPESNIETENINQKLVDSIQTQSSASVHVYDHSKRLGSIEVDNNNVFESIQAGLDNEQLPSYDTILISHNGKIVNNQLQPKMANDDNIHIIVKGKGGMMQGDPPDEGHHADDKTETKNNDRTKNTADTSSSTKKVVNKPEQKQCIPANARTISMTETNTEQDADTVGSTADAPIKASEQTQEIPADVKTLNPTDDNELTDTSGTTSTVDESVNKSEQTQEIPADVNTLNPADDNELTDTNGTTSTADESVNKSEQTPGIPADVKTLKPNDNNGITGTSGTESTADESVNKYEQTQEIPVDGNTLNPDDDNELTDTSGTTSTVDVEQTPGIPVDGKTLRPTDTNVITGTSGTGSTADESVNKYEQRPEIPADVTTFNPTDDNGITDTSGTKSTTDESVNKSAQVILKHGHADAALQVTNASPFVSTFSQRSEDSQARLIDELNLGNYFPDQLTYDSVMSISANEEYEADTLADIPRLMLRKLIMLDFKSRETDLNECLKKMNKRRKENLEVGQVSSSSLSTEDYHSLFDNNDDMHEECSSNLITRNPIDIFISIFICLNPTLKQKVCLKMFACHLAIPIIFPVKQNKQQDKVLMFSMWPLRLITVHDGTKETSIVNCKQNIVSFVRLGRPQISKSKLANEILNDTAHNTFFNYDCILGPSEKQASLGLVEASWFLPSPKQHGNLQTVAMFLNLRGDALCNAEQIEYLKRISRVMIIIADIEEMKNTKVLEHFKRAHFNVLFLLTGNVSKKFITNFKRFYMEASPVGFNADVVQGTKHGKNISLSYVKEAILNIIGPLLSDTNSAKTMQTMCEQAKEMRMVVDEFNLAFRKGRKLAKCIFSKVKDCPLSDIKTTYTPLQKECWKEFTDAMKRFRKPSSDINEKDRLKQKMTFQREKQWEDFKTGEQFMRDFIDTFLRLDDDNLVFFLDSLKFELDENSRREIPSYRKEYASKLNELKTKSDADKAQALTNVSKAEQNISEASFGIEHIFRELGQIFMSSLTANTRKFESNLAKAVARSIQLGYPFELMDGDVANVPLDWVERVFKELENMLGDKTLLKLSILGLQSSGKSTLLNAMFGLTFSVSGGRCTRGIYLQLLPVQKGVFSFDYVLVVDTEGLRAPELSVEKHQHDNELATMVLGLADITIVNIKGENTSEVKDILQICVHAFLRLKMANQSLQLRQSCIFIHQNVSDIGAKDSMIHTRKKLDETLDKMTLEAAGEENIRDIKCFKDVINFDSNKHVWYFSDLWKGDPPMAPANPGYSRDVREVKSFIFRTLAKHKDSYLNIFDSFVHIRDLWYGILANDFVFGFRNSLEIRAYNSLENKYQDLIWELERYTKQLTDKAEVEMKQFTAECEMDKNNVRGIVKYTGKIQNRYRDIFQEKKSDLKKDLKKYFEESDKKDDIAKWKHIKLTSWDLFANNFQGKLKRQLNDIESHCRVDYEMNTSLEKLKKEIYDQAKYLAEKMKGDRPSTLDIEAGFNEMWNEWIRKIDVEEEEAKDIEASLKSILFKTFEQHKDVLETAIRKHPHDCYQVFTTLEKNLNHYGFNNNYISVKKNFLKRMKHAFGMTSTVDPERYNEVVQFTNMILREVDVRFGDLLKKIWKFDETEMKEIPKCILQHIDRHNQDKGNKFTFLEPYKVTLCVHVFRYALPLLKRLDSEFRDKHSMNAKLTNHKNIVWRHFQDVVDEKSATVIACDRFCEIIRDHVDEKVKNSLPDLIYEHVVIEFDKAKFVFIARIMEDLVRGKTLEKFLEYISDPYTYAFKWLTEFINCKCFGLSDNLYTVKALSALQATFTVILNSLKKDSTSSLHDWLINVQGKIKDTVWIQMESFFVVEDQTITGLDDFITTVEKKLGEVQKELKEIFESETATTIKWHNNKTPYQISMDKLWGCKAICPFCSEPCKWNSIHTGTPHSCIQHRAIGVSGWHKTHSEKLVIESCSFKVHSEETFRCFATREGRVCTEPDSSEHDHPYKDYKKYFPGWDIAPCPDISSSKYWAWVLCTFNEEFAKHYNIKQADIPTSWTEYNQDDAIKSLRRYD